MHQNYKKNGYFHRVIKQSFKRCALFDTRGIVSHTETNDEVFELFLQLLLQPSLQRSLRRDGCLGMMHGVAAFPIRRALSFCLSQASWVIHFCILVVVVIYVTSRLRSHAVRSIAYVVARAAVRRLTQLWLWRQKSTCHDHQQPLDQRTAHRPTPLILLLLLQSHNRKHYHFVLSSYTTTLPRRAHVAGAR